jgi:hypothetical protein
MKNLAIVAMTGDQQQNWPTNSLQLGPFNLGRGWKDTTIPHEPGPKGMVVFGKESAYRVLEQHDYVVLQHWPGRDVLERLHSTGTRVGFWLNLLSVQESPMWNLVQRPLQQTLLSFPLKGTDGQNVITWPGAIATDVCHPLFTSAVCGALKYILDTSYGRERPDFFFIDELTDEWYCTARNKPALNRTSWYSAISQLTQALNIFGPVWGHNTTSGYPSVRSVVHEHATRGVYAKEEWLTHVGYLCTWRPFASATTSRIGLGWERQDDVPADWCTAVRDKTWQAEVVWQTARTGSAFQIFDPYAPT